MTRDWTITKVSDRFSGGLVPKRITIFPHLSLEEIQGRYRQANNPVERSHYQIIWLLAQGKTTKEVAALTGYSRSWIYELVWGYNRVGPESLGDGRLNNQGAQPLLTDLEQAMLWQALSAPPPDGGLWNGRKVADWMSKLLDRKVTPQRGWEYLRQMRFRLRSPRPHHEKADPVEQEAWKKKLTQEAVKVQAAHPDADVEVWCEDEHRLGLKPIMRRVWVPEGEQPTATVNWRFKWLWLAGESPSPIRTNLLVDFTVDQYFNIQPSVGGFCSTCRCWER